MRWPGQLTVGAVACLTALGHASLVQAQPQQKVEELPRIRITDPGRGLLPLAVPPAQGDAALATQTTEILRRDFLISGLFRQLDPASFPPALTGEPAAAFNSNNWSQVGAQGVVKALVRRGGPGVIVQGYLYQPGRGDAAQLTKSYQGSEVRPLVHQLVNDVIEKFTGLPGPFGSRIAFATMGATGEIATVGADGAEMAVLTKMRSECMLPAFSPNGREIAFNSFLRGGADLWVVSAAGGRARRVSSRYGLNTGPVWTLDSRSIVATLSYQGNAELYRLAASDGKEQARLTSSPGIDSSATLSPDGAQIAFVSERQGTPQVFVMSSSGGAARRLTFQGSYNTTPRWNPNKETPLIAFTGRDERSVFDIFVYDMKTSKIDRVTQGQGSNMSPSWSPDGRLLVYASSRGGLWVMNVQTKQETQLMKGGAKDPSWGPAPPR